MFALTLQLALHGPTARPVVAQSFECPPPATPAATPAAAATSEPEPEASPAAFPEGGGNLTVFAAASLTDVFGEMKATLEAAHPGLTITYNFAGSPALVTQLAEGAEADVVALASVTQINAAIDQGVVDGEPTIFTQNRLAIIVPADNPAGITTAADLAKDGVKLVVALAEVPVGQYARESVCKMGRDAATYGEGFVDAVAGNVVSEEDNVRAVVTKVQLGEADAGIVYTTDVTPQVAEDVLVIEIPVAVNVIARYPIARVAGGNTELANAFIDYVLGPDGQATLQAWGFEPKP
jgi:molybdate transport system substrate-binding protein